MKRLLIILLFAFSLFTYGQNYNDREKKTTLNDNDGVFVHDITANKTYGVAMSDIAAYMFGNPRTFSSTLSITGAVTLPSTLSTGLERGIGFHNGDFAWSIADGRYLVASQAWVIQYVADEGIAGDLSAYATKAGNNPFSGQNTFSNLNDFRTGSLYLAAKTSWTANAKTNSMFVDNNTGKVRILAKDSNNDPHDQILASESWVTSNFSQVTGFLKSDGSQTNVTPQITFADGNYGMIFGTGGVLQVPYFATASSVSTYRLGGNSTNLFYSGYEILNEQQINEKRDSNYSYQSPEAVTAASDTLYFGTDGDNNYRKAIYTVPQNGLTIYLNNSGTGAVSIVVWGTQEDVTIQSVASEIIQYSGGIKPTFDYASGTNNNKKWLLTFTRDGDGYIDCQWNWVQKEQ